MAATLARDDGTVMGIVLAGGDVRSGDRVRVELPPQPHRSPEPV